MDRFKGAVSKVQSEIADRLKKWQSSAYDLTSADGVDKALKK